MKKELIIFDFDGTLADTQKPIVAAKQKAMQELGLKVYDAETCASTIGLSAKAGFEKLYPDMDEKELNEAVTVYRNLFEEMKEIMPPTLFPGVRDTLKALKDAGAVLTIATSRNTPSLEFFLEKLDIAKYFSYQLGGDDTKLLKPNPEPVLKTLQELNYSIDQALVVGDMPVDIKMGMGAGVDTCGVTFGNADYDILKEAGATYIIDDMQELISLVL